jgi:hypothetical protein
MFWIYICSIILIMGNVFNYVVYHKRPYQKVRRISIDWSGDNWRTTFPSGFLRTRSIACRHWGSRIWGDAVYELMVRSWLARSGRATAKGLHKAAVT